MHEAREVSLFILKTVKQANIKKIAVWKENGNRITCGRIYAIMCMV